ncbi:unnamed protein product [Polarella glacialis]|uniref:Secreted protein n=1 Tax=Polarella glacialis TaxID=89957 RepID=A0A813GGM9_POLGL|nr:unnamed protein product [Polarella glacialis]
MLRAPSVARPTYLLLCLCSSLTLLLRQTSSNAFSGQHRSHGKSTCLLPGSCASRGLLASSRPARPKWATSSSSLHPHHVLLGVRHASARQCVWAGAQT